MLTVEPASAADAATILGLRHAAEDWLSGRGIDQWTPREVPLSTVVSQIDAGEFYIARREPGAPIVGALRNYYLRQGFRYVCRRDFGDGSSWFSVALFEMSTGL